jgi:hypothetical protein
MQKLISRFCELFVPRCKKRDTRHYSNFIHSSFMGDSVLSVRHGNRVIFIQTPCGRVLEGLMARVLIRASFGMEGNPHEDIVCSSTLRCLRRQPWFSQRDAARSCWSVV